jgi:hypothetical protein
MRRPWMVVVASLLVLSATADVSAQGRHDDGDVFEDDGTIYPGWLCVTCQLPRDFAAFAYNAYWSKTAWAWGSQLGIPFRVYNLDGEWVVIWFEDFLFNVPSLLPDTIKIKVRLRSGEIVTIEMVQGQSSVQIGGSGTTSGGSGGGINPGGGLWLVVTTRPTGVVAIIDPDPDGTFPAFDQEE